jgi:hypothetical protein
MSRRVVRGLFLIAVAAGGLGVVPGANAQFIPPQPQAPIVPQSRYQSQQNVGIRCSTSAGVCVLNTAGPVGARCGCTTARGVVSGQIIR